MGDRGLLRVYLQDNAWATIPASSSTTSTEICDMIRRKRNISKSENPGSYSLVMVTAQHEQPLRQLAPTESPLAIQENLRKLGQLDNFKFMYKKNEDDGGGAEDAGESSEDEDQYAALSRSGAARMRSQAKLLPTNSRGPPSASDVSIRDGSVAEPGTAGQGQQQATGSKSNEIRTMIKGFLQKKGQRMKAWRKRWFVLYPDEPKLCYYRSDGGKLVGSIDLSEVMVATRKIPIVSANAALQNSGGGGGGGGGGSGGGNNNGDRGFYFDLITTNRIFELKASSKREQDDWVVALKRCCPLEEENHVMDDLQLWLEDREGITADAHLSFNDDTTTLKGALANSHCTQLFLAFLKKKVSSERLEFWLMAEEYRKQTNDEKAREIGNVIFQKFLKEGANDELPNLPPANTREQLYGEALKRDKCPSGLTALEEVPGVRYPSGLTALAELREVPGMRYPSRTAFKELQTHSFGMLESDPDKFPEFLHSDFYRFASLSVPVLDEVAAAVNQHLEDFPVHDNLRHYLKTIDHFAGEGGTYRTVNPLVYHASSFESTNDIDKGSLNPNAKSPWQMSHKSSVAFAELAGEDTAQTFENHSSATLRARSHASSEALFE